jgi:hypothetical protein
MFRYTPDANRRTDDWLVYHHYHRMPPAPKQNDGPDVPQFRESPVTDVCGYNQSRPRREEDVHPVADLLLSMRLVCNSGSGNVAIRIGDGNRGFETRLRFANGVFDGFVTAAFDAAGEKAITTSFNSEMRLTSGDVANVGANSLVETSIVDQQFLLAIDGRTVVALPFDRPSRGPTPLARPVAIAAEGIDVAVRDLRLYRDVYYTAPPGGLMGTATEPTRLGPDAYYVLGDNSPMSDDSRTWPRPGTIDAKLLLGKPLIAIPSVVLSPWQGSHIQVPNPLAIRYIR